MLRTHANLVLGLLLATLIGAIPAAADPTLGIQIPTNTPTGPPVELDECKLNYNGGWLVGSLSGITLKFTNDTTVVADIVEVRVTDADSTLGILRDVGIFSPGVEITHTLKEGQGTFMWSPLFSHPAITCTIVAAHFTSGQTWTASAAEPANGGATQAAAADTPTPVPETPPSSCRVEQNGSLLDAPWNSDLCENARALWQHQLAVQHASHTSETSSGPKACDAHRAAAEANAAYNAGDIQDYTTQLHDARDAAETLGVCSLNAQIGDGPLYAADKAEMLAVAGLASVALGNRTAAAGYLASARRIIEETTTDLGQDTALAKEEQRANAVIAQLAQRLGK